MIVPDGMQIRLGWLLTLASLWPLLSCKQSDRTVPVAGRVLIDGQPLTNGDVIVAPHGQRPAFGKLDAEGRFVLTTTEPGDGTYLGMHSVAVRASKFVDSFHKQWYAPKKYSEVATSGLTLTVDGPTDAAVVELTWDGAHPFIESFERAGQ